MNDTNIKYTLEELLRYYNRTRAVGHTNAAIHGVNNVASIFVAANIASKRSYPIDNKTKVITLSAIDNNRLEGCNLPIIFDNNTLHVLFQAVVDKISSLENQIEDLQTETHYWERKARNQNGPEY